VADLSALNVDSLKSLKVISAPKKMDTNIKYEDIRRQHSNEVKTINNTTFLPFGLAIRSNLIKPG